MSTVGVIGGAGFIGSFVTRAFLEQGNAVRASVTDIGQREKFAHLEALDGAERLEVVALTSADLGVSPSSARVPLARFAAPAGGTAPSPFPTDA